MRCSRYACRSYRYSVRPSYLPTSLVLQDLLGPQISTRVAHSARKGRYRLGRSSCPSLLQLCVRPGDRIFPNERQRLDVAACYLILAYTGCRPAEIVDGEKPIPTKDLCWNELFGSQAALPSATNPPEDASPDIHSKEIAKLLGLETQCRGRPKALCYEDIQLMVIRHPDAEEDVLTMSIKFTHHKGSDNRPKPYVFCSPIFQDED